MGKRSLLFQASILAVLVIINLSCGFGVSGPDTEPPFVNIVSPQANSTVSRCLEKIKVDVRDNDTVTKVEFFSEGQLFGTAFDEPWEFGWDTTDLSDTTFDLRVEAYDASGNVAADSIQVSFRSLEAFVNDKIVITEIGVTGVPLDEAFGPLFEIEVHLFDTETNFFLGCSGQSSGLER
jgi:hypothetical protein